MNGWAIIELGEVSTYVRKLALATPEKVYPTG